MAITVFDAVGKFTADTRNLDDFITKLDRALPDASQRAAASTKLLKDAQENLRTSLKALKQDGGDTLDNWQKIAEAQRQVALTSAGAKRAQDDLRQSLGTMKESTKEARGEAMLLGEAFGIHLPRHVTSFIATLPGVGKALTAAFAVTAVGFIVNALGEAEIKIEEVARALAGWDEEAKKAYADQIKLNQVFIELANQQAEAKIKEKERGLEGATLTRQQIADNKELLALVGQRLTTLAHERQVAQDQLDAEKKVASGVEAWAKGSFFIEERQEKIKQLTATVKSIDDQTTAAIREQISLKEQQGDKESQLQHQSLTEYIATETAKTEARRVQANAQLDADLAVWRAEYAARIITSNELVGLEAGTEQKREQIDLAALKEKLRLLELDPTKNKNAIITANSEIEKLEKQHQTKLIDQETEYIQRKRAILLSLTNLGKKPGELDQSPINSTLTLSVNDKQLLGAMDILAKLGDETSQAAKKAGEAQAAYDQLVQVIEQDSKPAIESQALLTDSVLAFKEAVSGLRTNELLGLRTVIQAEITSNQQWGQSTDDLEKKLQAVENQLKKVGIAVDRVNQGTARAPQLLDTWSKHLLKNRQDLTTAEKSVDAFSLAIGDAFGSAVQQWVLGQQSFGKALQQALAEELAVIAAKSAAWGLYFTAWGIADLYWHPDRAAADFTSAAEFFALAAASGAAAFAIKPSTGDTGAGSNSGTSVASPAAQSSPNPVQVSNIQHFATGGLISGPTLAVIGDSVRSASGGQREAAIPLDDPQAVAAIVEALGGSHTGGTVVNVKGLISPDNLNRVMKTMNRRVARGQARLVSSNSYKVTRKT